MDIGLIAQHIMNGLMLGMMYALVAVGFTLFFGVLDVIKFSHGDVLTVGAFTALATYIGLQGIGVTADALELLAMLVASIGVIALLGAGIAKAFVLPLRSAPALNTLLITLMLGTVLREAVRLFYPDGANPKPFPRLLPTGSTDLGHLSLRLDNAILLTAGALVIVGLQFLLKRTKLGLAIRAVAQDEETAKTMGVNFNAIVLITLMLGTVLREMVRLFYPDGANPKPFPRLLPADSVSIGNFNLRLDNAIMLTAGVLVIVGLQLLLNRTKLGLAIRAVAQDEETAKTMGVNFNLIVLVTFAIGSGLAAYAGVMNGLYYNEINFGIGLYLGVVGFSAAIVGGLGNIYGAILGGFLFAALQTIGAVSLPFASAYKDVFAFGVVIAIMAWRPTGLIPEKLSERV